MSFINGKMTMPYTIKVTVVALKKSEQSL